MGYNPYPYPQPFATLQSLQGGTFFNVKYQNLYECRECWAVTTNPNAHALWHQTQKEMTDGHSTDKR